MKYMSRVKPEDAQNPEHSIKQLRQYLMAHPSLSTEHFTEMITLARKLGNDKLLEQCKVTICFLFSNSCTTKINMNSIPIDVKIV